MSAESRIENLEKDVRCIKENHLVHLQDDITDIKIGLARHGSDLVWLKKFFWIVATASIGSLLAGIINLLINY